jgi:hypothetical protein
LERAHRCWFTVPRRALRARVDRMTLVLSWVVEEEPAAPPVGAMK